MLRYMKIIIICKLEVFGFFHELRCFLIKKLLECSCIISYKKYLYNHLH